MGLRRNPGLAKLGNYFPQPGSAFLLAFRLCSSGHHNLRLRKIQTAATDIEMKEEPTRSYSRSGIWFWSAIALGAALRFYLVVFTEGTQDVAIWERHARDVRDFGLIGYYHVDPSANHPPFISQVESLLLRASDATGIPFRIFLR